MRDKKISAVDLVPQQLIKSEEEYHEEMLNVFPSDIDTSEGNLAYDHTRPVAMALAQFAGYDLQELRRASNPLTALGDDLDNWATVANTTRNAPTHAAGYIKVAGTPGTVIEEGSRFYTIGDEVKDSQAYVTSMTYVIGESGELKIKVYAVEAGPNGNAEAGEIAVYDTSLKGIDAVTNETSITGGVGEESDDSLRWRVVELLRSRDGAGNKKDYEKWAKSVDGVGAVIVQPLWNGGGTVKVLITDSVGQVANEDLINRVKQYIDPTDGLGDGMAPIGAVVTVGTLDILAITLSMHLIHAADDIELLKKEIAAAVTTYTSSVDVIRVNEIGAIIIKIDNVIDYSNLLVNGSKENIVLSQGERAVVDEVILYDA